MDFIFLGSGAANGYDQLGHFLRTEVVANACIKYFVAASQAQTQGCNAHLGTVAKATTATKASIPAGTGVEMARTLAVIKGATPADAIKKYPGPTHIGEAHASSVSPGTDTPQGQPVGGSAAGTTYYSPSAEAGEAEGMLLNYLLGN